MIEVKNNTPVALFDLDGTLVDYDGTLRRDMDRLKSPDEPSYGWERDKEPDYIRARMDMIRNNHKWWQTLDKLQIGFDIYESLKAIGYRVVVLTQGPRKNSDAWKGKHLWCMENLSPEDDLVITRDKSLMYGKILVDDWPPYVMGWLEHRPRGLVIMPAQPWNIGIKHPQIIRYDGEQTVRHKFEKAARTLFKATKKEFKVRN